MHGAPRESVGAVVGGVSLPNQEWVGSPDDPGSAWGLANGHDATMGPEASASRSGGGRQVRGHGLIDSIGLSDVGSLQRTVISSDEFLQKTDTASKPIATSQSFFGRYPLYSNILKSLNKIASLQSDNSPGNDPGFRRELENLRRSLEDWEERWSNNSKKKPEQSENVAKTDKEIEDIIGELKDQVEDELHQVNERLGLSDVSQIANTHFADLIKRNALK